MEVIKLLLILTILMTVQLKFSIRKTVQLLYNEIVCRPLDTIPLALPSLLYVVQDNLIIYSLSCLDAATYQVRAHPNGLPRCAARSHTYTIMFY